MKKIFIIPILVMVLTITLSVTVQAKNYTPVQKNNTGQITLIDDLLQDEEFQDEIKGYLIEEYGENYMEKIERNQHAVQSAKRVDSNFQKTRSGEVIYPDYIGGLYIDDNDNLVIQMVESAIPNEKSIEYSTYQSTLAVDDTSKVEYVKYSYEELKEVHDEILNYFLDEDKNNNISGLYIDVISNRVIVELNNYTEKEIENFKDEVIDSPVVSFKNTAGFKTISTVNPGAGFTSSTYQGCSYGYRARTASGQEGVVTAAHCFKDKTNGSITLVGSVKNWKCAGTMDAAFVQNTKGATLTNNFARNYPLGNIANLSTNVVSSFYSGQKIAKLGVKTGFTLGSVNAPSYSGSVSVNSLNMTVNFTDLVYADILSQEGDSGGIVIDQKLNFNDGYHTAGICTASSSTNSNHSLFTKASNINSAFGLSRY